MRLSIDNRIFARIDGEFGVRYSPQGSYKEYCTTTRNISGGGVRMPLLKKLEPGTVLDLEIFKYNTDLKAVCRGKVAWMWDEPMNQGKGQLFEAGISFLDQRFLYIGRLINYLETQKTGNTL
ncbi:MAG: PilZ domain-containing protein [Candidatus Omnitrophica bacterium]|nr:PilZ domain-containing protein [Candidatus Omnitrophota bacterium]